MTSSPNNLPGSPPQFDGDPRFAQQPTAGESTADLSRGELEQRLHGMRTMLAETLRELGRIRMSVESMQAAGANAAGPVDPLPAESGEPSCARQPAERPGADEDVTQESLEQRFALLRRRLSDRMETHSGSGGPDGLS